jgi:hypothetical protein
VTTVSGSNRVIRGGSWNNDARNCRSAYRNNDAPGNRNDNLGFRLLSTGLSRRGRFTDLLRVLQAMSRPSSCAGRWPDKQPCPAAFGRPARVRRPPQALLSWPRGSAMVSRSIRGFQVWERAR